MSFWKIEILRGRRCWTGVLCLLLSLSGCHPDGAADDGTATVRVAVAGNFAAPQAELALLFEASSGIEVETSLGATGQLYAQIRNGAPFDLFLAADTARPSLLETENFAVPGSRFTYAIGRLVLFAPTWDSVSAGDLELRSRAIEHLAIANPQTAPYCAAALDVLERWDLKDDFDTRIVRGENVAQVYQFVETGASEAGFVALSHVIRRDPRHYTIVSDSLHPQILQDAVLLRHGETNRFAGNYLEFLQSEEGRKVIQRFGYSLVRSNR